MRNEKRVPVLPKTDCLTKALDLSLGEVEYLTTHFKSLMSREPTPDEREFWQAVLDYRRQRRQELSPDE